MTELEPFSWTRSKFVKIREFLEIAIFDILAEILIPRYGPNFGAIDLIAILNWIAEVLYQSFQLPLFVAETQIFVLFQPS